jgi:hypothetical protein
MLMLHTEVGKYPFSGKRGKEVIDKSIALASQTITILWDSINA